jgi:DHA2 family multidrug resistance protein-like MFS transporter
MILAAVGAAFQHAVGQRIDAGPSAAEAVASGATANLTAGLRPADAASLQDAAHAALAHGIDVAALVGAAVIVVGTILALLLARGRRPAQVAVPAPQPAGAA